MVRFNAQRQPDAVAHHAQHPDRDCRGRIIPIVILLVIAVPSFKLLFLQLNMPAADLTVKATGKQWYWSYSYPDNGKFEFDSLMLKDNERKRGPAAPARASTTRWSCRSTRLCMCSPPAPTSSTPSRCRRSASRSTPFPAGSTRPGSRRRAKASITASARNCAARITPSCRSRYAW